MKMEKYIGTKLIQAEKMNRKDYNDYRGWELPSDENGDDEGYLVEYLDGGANNHSKHLGYISWSPEEQFDNAYRKTDGISFGLAIEALKKDLKVCRAGWNGKGMWLVLAAGTDGKVIAMSILSDYAKAGIKEICIDPHIDMYTAQGTMQPGWLASQAEMLADDWMIVE